MINKKELNSKQSNKRFSLAFYDFYNSWVHKVGYNSINSLLEWVNERNTTLKVNISKISFNKCYSWKYDTDKGEIYNLNKSFFSITGLRSTLFGEVIEQPIIIQDEIGFLGIICSYYKGILHFLMQAKIEPGNINKIQISPTLQATKSNFMLKHGGKKPLFLDYFTTVDPSNIVVDQIQSEQSSRFLGKRNRNVIIYVDQPIPESASHKWMTLGQIKHFMKMDNLVNMDTRTVVSCIPWTYLKNPLPHKGINDLSLYFSITSFPDIHEYTRIYNYINKHKMFLTNIRETIPLKSLKKWIFDGYEYRKEHNGKFKVVFCNIEIEGREVKRWNQPLIEAIGISTIGLFCCNDNGLKKFLVKAMPEIGCFDNIEIGPTIQLEHGVSPVDMIEQLFMDILTIKQENIIVDVLLSEEGGRFYHEQNRNVIIQIDNMINSIPEGYFWCSYSTLNSFIQINNCVNIQLRNLLSLLEI